MFHTQRLIRHPTILNTIQLDLKRYKKTKANISEKTFRLSEKVKIAFDIDVMHSNFEDIINNLKTTYEDHFCLYLNPELILDTKVRRFGIN